MRLTKLAFIVTLLELTACSLAPRFQRPPMSIPCQYREATPWIKANPTLAKAQQNKPWWSLFSDKTLNQLEEALTTNNPTIQMSLARFDESKALLQAARSKQYPTLLLLAGASREQDSTQVANALNTLNFSTQTIDGLLNYEIDAFGRIRNTVSMRRHGARASEFDLAAVKLSLQTVLATAYFELLEANAEQTILDRMVQNDTHALSLVRHLHTDGATSALEEAQAVNQLENAKTAATNMNIKRATLNHSLAILIGQVPAQFKPITTSKPPPLAVVSPSVPSQLLQQRPDIAAAIERVQAANASIGVARAAFFPSLTFNAILGYQSTRPSSLFSSPSLMWSLGPPAGLNLIPPEISQVVFDGFYLQANLRRAKATYYETVQAYQQTVLQAFKEVEDALVSIDRLEKELGSQERAKNAAHVSFYQVKQRMKQGMDTYLAVYPLENAYLQAEFDLIHLQTRARIACLNLINALGGGFDLTV